MNLQKPLSVMLRLPEPFARALTLGGMLLTLCLFILLATGCQTTVPPADTMQTPQASRPAYTLGTGDKLRVTVYEHENLSGIFAVDDAGTIALPLVRRISVKGMTLPELEKAITRQLLDNHIVDPRVSIDLVELRPFCVLGEVRNPGCFGYVHGMTASKAIAMAGGYTYRAKINQLAITREDGSRLVGTHDTPVFSGDVIEVPERYF